MADLKEFQFHECWAVRSGISGKLKVKKSVCKTAKQAAEFYAHTYGYQFRVRRATKDRDGGYECGVPTRGDVIWHPLDVREWSHGNDSGTGGEVAADNSGNDSGDGGGEDSASLVGGGVGDTGKADGSGSEP